MKEKRQNTLRSLSFDKKSNTNVPFIGMPSIGTPSVKFDLTKPVHEDVTPDSY